jgi:hypothetical protein
MTDLVDTSALAGALKRVVLTPHDDGYDDARGLERHS